MLRRCCGRSVGLAVLSVCIRSASRADSVQAVLRPAVLRSTDDSKADICDGTVDSEGESFGRPVFAGHPGANVARCRSWREAEPAVFEGPKPGLAQSRSGWLAAIGGEVAARVPGRPELGALSGRIWRHFTEMVAGAAGYRSGMAGRRFGRKLAGGTRRTFGEKGELPLGEGPGGGERPAGGAESPQLQAFWGAEPAGGRETSMLAGVWRAKAGRGGAQFGRRFWGCF